MKKSRFLSGRLFAAVIMSALSGGSFVSNATPVNKRGFLDQKRKRKKLRANASFARSKKCTTKRK
jgi:hypothetical protein